jgi:hypothetical protein
LLKKKKEKKKEQWKKREGAPLSACLGPFYFNLGLLAHPRQNVGTPDFDSLIVKPHYSTSTADR